MAVQLREDYIPSAITVKTHVEDTSTVDTLPSIRDILLSHTHLLQAHTLMMKDMASHLSTLTSTCLSCPISQTSSSERSDPSSIESFSTRIEDIYLQLKVLTSQLAKLETNRLDEVNKLQQDIAHLKKTVHSQLESCQDSIRQEIKHAIENSERHTLAYELWLLAAIKERDFLLG